MKKLALILALVASIVLPTAVSGHTPEGSAGADCMYRSVPVEGWSGKMKIDSIIVHGPYVSVDEWRFAIKRQIGTNPWKTVYRSRFLDNPYRDHEVDIEFPRTRGQGANFKVVIKTFNQRRDGSRDLLDQYPVQLYDVYHDGTYMWTDRGTCYHAWLFD